MSNKEQRKAPVLRFKGFTDDWEQRKFNELGKLYYGKSAPKWSVVEKGGTPCIRYGELYTKYSSKIDNVYSHTSIDKSKLKFSTGNELLIPRVGEEPLDFAKHTSWLSIPNVAIGEMITVLKTKENPLFLANYLRAKYVFKFARLVEGGNVSNLYFERYEDTNILIPSKNEQQNISKLILKIDKLITLQQRKMDNLSKIQKSLENNLFPDINHVRKLKASKNNWHTKKLNNIFNERKKCDQYGQLLSVSMTKGVYPFNPSERKDNSSSNKSNYRVVRKGDIAYNSMRMWQGACGVSKYDGIVSPAYTVITPGSNEDASFYYYYFKNNRMKFEFRRHSQGLTSDTWNLKFPLFKDITIEVPNNEKEQIRIRKLLDTLNEAIKHGNGRIRKLKLLKSFLLQKMFI